jgi:hypothetical protein
MAFSFCCKASMRLHLKINEREGVKRKMLYTAVVFNQIQN